MNEIEHRENLKALRARWTIFWLLVGSLFCLGVYFGLFIGWKVYGG